MRREALATCERGLAAGNRVLPTKAYQAETDTGDGEIVSRYSLKFQAEGLGVHEAVTPSGLIRNGLVSQEAEIVPAGE